MKLHTAAIFAACFALSACGLIYKPDITQGNIYSQNQTAQIQPGMSREQVHQILGTPSLTDPFHANQETYQFSFKSGTTGRTYQRAFNINYQNDIVIETNETPIEIKN